MSDNPKSCVTCGHPMGTRFCAHCGEKRVGPDDHTLRRFFEHLFVAFTNADGKVFLTLRYLLLHPGRLTADYLRGRRKPYIPPFQLFLICNLIFFLLHPLIGGSKTLTTDLDTNLHYLWHSSVAQSFVTPRLAARTQSVEAYAAVFNPAAVTQAKTLVILLVPIFSLAAMGLYWRHRRHCSAHLVFALHVCSFWLLFICASLTLTNLALRLLRTYQIFPSADAVELGSLLFGLAAMTGYLFRSACVVFDRQPRWITFTKAVTLAVALQLSLQAYRFVLFFITFWST